MTARLKAKNPSGNALFVLKVLQAVARGAGSTSLVAIAELNGVEPQAWLTDVLERMVSGRTKAHELARLLPWAWQAERLTATADA